MGQHVDSLLHDQLCISVIVDVREGFHVMLVGLIDDGGGDFRPQFGDGATAVVDNDLHRVGALFIELFHPEARDVGRGRVLFKLETLFDGVGAGALDIAMTLIVTNLEDIVAVAAHADGGSDAVEREVAELQRGIVADVRMGVDDARDDGLTG
jgi:hypothetical protein